MSFPGGIFGPRSFPRGVSLALGPFRGGGISGTRSLPWGWVGPGSVSRWVCPGVDGYPCARHGTSEKWVPTPWTYLPRTRDLEYNGTRSESGRYASHWNVFWFDMSIFTLKQGQGTFECTFDDSNPCSNIFEVVNPFSSSLVQLQWIRGRGQTGTSNSGPNVDHTTGNCEFLISLIYLAIRKVIVTKLKKYLELRYKIVSDKLIFFSTWILLLSSDVDWICRKHGPVKNNLSLPGVRMDQCY